VIIAVVGCVDAVWEHGVENGIRSRQVDVTTVWLKAWVFAEGSGRSHAQAGMASTSSFSASIAAGTFLPFFEADSSVPGLALLMKKRQVRTGASRWVPA
jgi:hypothetical protein